jgi:hypothetical protein
MAAINYSGHDMKAHRKTCAALLLFCWVFIPAMVCASSGEPMTAAERACCRAMQDQCGQMAMPASHGCCQKAPLGVHTDALDTKAFHQATVTTAWLNGPIRLNSVTVNPGRIEPSDSSPPTSPPSTVSVLRI